jgi:ADP-heptose:LPS heptosyltransferase
VARISRSRISYFSIFNSPHPSVRRTISTMNTPTNPTHPATQAWVRYRSIAYLTGRGLAFGVGDDIFPRVAIAPGKFSLNVDLLPNPNISVCDGRLDIFQDQVFDHIVVGPALGMCPSPGGQMRMMVDKLRQGGHAVLYFKKNLEPNAYTKFRFEEDSMMELLASSGAWRIKYQDTRGTDMLLIAKKIAGSRGTIVPMKPKAPKRACIVRYGALGDMVMITPLIRKLAEDGFEVTMNITPYAAPLLENNPHVANIVIQEREAIPNRDLGGYWNEWAADYDRYINLSESIEGRLLKVEGRRDYHTSKSFREAACGSTNYYDWTMTLGGYPNCTGTRGELYFSPQERKEAAKFRKDLAGKFVVGWSLNGSSHHKLYPMTEPVVNEFLARHPDVVVFLLGGPEAQQYEFDHPQVQKTCGTWQLRKTLAFIAMVADAMVGPESMAMNVAACYDIPKITFLSHSTRENLTKYWTNDYSLEPNQIIAACYPCHQLHYTLESCPLAEMRDKETSKPIARGPICAMGAIEPERVWATLETIYTKHGAPVGELSVV